MICQSCRAALRARTAAVPAAMRAFTTRSASTSFRAQSIANKTRLNSSSIASAAAPKAVSRPIGARSFSSQPEQEAEEESMTAAENAIANLLREKLSPTELLVRDVSGGCGSMYAIDIASPAFKGANMLKQQRMVNAALGDVMKTWHGVQLNTRVSE